MQMDSLLYKIFDTGVELPFEDVTKHCILKIEQERLLRRLSKFLLEHEVYYIYCFCWKGNENSTPL